MKNLRQQIGKPISTMPDASVKVIIREGILNPSPYNGYSSGSYYNCAGKSWDFTPDGAVRVSDHWNFYSRNELHCETNVPVEKGKWAIADYDEKIKQYILRGVFPKLALRDHYQQQPSTLSDRLRQRKIKIYDEKRSEIDSRKSELISSLAGPDVLKKMRLNLTTLQKMSHVVKTLNGSGYKMGDKFTLIVGELQVIRDCREYYSGRGAKYNATVRHGDIVVKISKAAMLRIFAEKFESSLKLEKIRQNYRRYQNNLPVYSMQKTTQEYLQFMTNLCYDIKKPKRIGFLGYLRFLWVQIFLIKGKIFNKI